LEKNRQIKKNIENEKSEFSENVDFEKPVINEDLELQQA